MAVAAPARRASSAPASAPPRPAPTEPKKRPRDRPKPGGARRASVAAPARKAPARKAPARKPRKVAIAAPARKAPARRAPARRSAPARTGQLIPLAVGRTAGAVYGLPDSGPIVRLTRGRGWIALLGILLVGIVALNVVTLSFAASSGKVDERATTLEKENTQLNARKETKFSLERIRHEAGKHGLGTPTAAEPRLIEAGRDDVATAAARLAAAGSE